MRPRRNSGFRETRRIDLSGRGAAARFLEGTGSLVLDHRARVAYASRSPRTDEALVREWATALGYEPFLFDAATADGTPVYHTNVLLWLGETRRRYRPGMDCARAARRAGSTAARLGSRAAAAR